VLQQDDGKRRFVQTVAELSRAFALCATTDAAMALRDDVAFFQAVRAALLKNVGDARRSPEEIDAAVRQLVSSAVTASEGIVDVFSAAGLARPDISILDDRFLTEVRGLKHKNLAADMLAKLLRGEIARSTASNVVLSQRFSEKLKQALNAYHNHALSAQEIIEQLIALAKELRSQDQRHTELGLAPDETAFYDALALNESAVAVLGNDQLKLIAVELIRSVRGSVTIDWQFKESARAKMRVAVKKILRRFGYPPDLQDDAVKLVLAQTEVLCERWMATP
jgi:type I restriction enzyme R subunit